MRFPVSGSKWSNGRNEKVIYNFERADRVPFIYTSEPSLEFSDRIVNIYMTNVVDAYNRTYEEQRLMFSWRREPFSISEWVELSLSIWALQKQAADAVKQADAAKSEAKEVREENQRLEEIQTSDKEAGEALSRRIGQWIKKYLP